MNPWTPNSVANAGLTAKHGLRASHNDDQKDDPMTDRTGDRMTDRMTDLIAVYTTVANDQQAQRLASAATQSNLAACVQTEPIRSTYRWQGQVECQEEIRVLFKTTRTAYRKLEELLVELHPYELPAIFCVPVWDASAAYTQWVQSSCL